MVFVNKIGLLYFLFIYIYIYISHFDINCSIILIVKALSLPQSNFQGRGSFKKHNLKLISLVLNNAAEIKKPRDKKYIQHRITPCLGFE